MNEVEEFYLQHYGVKGMKWGVRRNRPEGVSRRTNREAKKDAKEYTKAKMYYGEGAGTRRVHIHSELCCESCSMLLLDSLGRVLYRLSSLCRLWLVD